MKIRLCLIALAGLVSGFGFSAGVHHDKWLHIDSAHFIVGVHQHYVDVWHGNGDGGINVRLTGSTCAGHSLKQGFYIDQDC